MVKKSLLIFLVAVFWSSPVSFASENDAYTVIYGEVSAFNGNPQEAEWITKAILYASDTYGVDPLLVTAVMEQESHFNLDGASPAGAIGLMQLMPGTATMIGVNPYDPLDNVVGGVVYLRNQIEKFSDGGAYAVTNAVAAYNAGPQAVVQHGGVPPYEETRNYVIGVANHYNRLNSMRKMPIMGT